jgi:RTX calcium-binding nonapeptide repeat (4 copies)
MTFINAHFTHGFDMTNKSLPIPDDPDPFVGTFITEYTSEEIAINVSRYTYYVIQGEFPEELPVDGIPGDAKITGYSVEHFSYFGHHMRETVTDLSVTWSEATTTKDWLIGSSAVTFIGSSERDVAYGSEKSDNFTMAGGNDSVFGLGGHDVLMGGAGRDFLFGGAGVDMMFGGKGNDVLKGGAHSDFFLFSGKFGHDVVRDCNGDRVVIDIQRELSLDAFREKYMTKIGSDIHVQIDENRSIIFEDANIKNIDFRIEDVSLYL